MAKNQVTVTFAGDAKQLSQTFSKIRTDSDKMDRSLTGASTRIANSFGSLAQKIAVVGTAIGGAVAAGAVIGGRALLDMANDASDLNEAASKVATVFGSSADEINRFAADAAQSLGLSKKDALDAAGGFGNLFDQLGFGRGEMTSMSRDIISLSADFASFHNADITDVLDAQSAAFRGEYDSLQRFLPLINAAAVEQKAMAITGKTAKDTITEQEKALAVYQLMLEGAGAAQGDFSRTSDGMANQTRIAEAEIANLRAEIGQKMVPIAQKLTEWKLKLANVLADKVAPAIETVSGWIDDNRGSFEKVAEVVTGTVIPALRTFVEGVVDRIQKGVSFLMEYKDTWIAIGNGIADVVVPAAEKIAAWITTITDNRDAMVAIGIGIAAVLVPSFVAWAISAAAAAAATLLAMAPLILIGLAVAALAYLIITNWDWIKEKTGEVWDWISEKVGDVWSAISGFVTDQWDQIYTAVTDSIDALVSAFNGFKDTVGDIWDAIGDAMLDPIKDAVSAIKRAWNNTIGGKSMSIPGIPGIFDGASFTIPSLATGGVVPATPGGRIVRISEGGEDEAVIPLSKLGSMAGGGGGETVLRIESDGTRFGDALAEVLRRTVRAQGGSVQAVLG